MSPMLRSMTGSLLWVIVLFVPAILADDTLPTDKFYTIDFMKPQGSAAALKVHFVAQATPEQVDSFLHYEITLASSWAGGKTDVLATAYYGECKLPLPDGSLFLIYAALGNKIMREKEYYAAAKPRPPSSMIFNVSFDVRTEINDHGLLRINGATNLPKGTAIAMELSSPAVLYHAVDTEGVSSKGEFVSQWFSAHYRALPMGSYRITVSTLPSVFQPRKVQNVIGSNGENIGGPLVVCRAGDYIVLYDNNFILK